jgi:hypothetical protein
VEAVDNQLAQPARQRQQHPGGRLDGHGRSGHGGQPLAPRAGGIDDHIGRHLAVSAGHMVVGHDPGDPPAGLQHAGDLGEGPQLGTAQPRRGEEAQRQPHGVHGRVRHPHRRLEGPVEAWLQGEGLGRS